MSLASSATFAAMTSADGVDLGFLTPHQKITPVGFGYFSVEDASEKCFPLGCVFLELVPFKGNERDHPLCGSEETFSCSRSNPLRGWMVPKLAPVKGNGQGCHRHPSQSTPPRAHLQTRWRSATWGKNGPGPSFQLDSRLKAKGRTTDQTISAKEGAKEGAHVCAVVIPKWFIAMAIALRESPANPKPNFPQALPNHPQSPQPFRPGLRGPEGQTGLLAFRDLISFIWPGGGRAVFKAWLGLSWP